MCLYGAQPFLIEEVEKLEVDEENDHRYFFYAPLATLELIDKSNSSLPVVKKKARFHLPVHLLKEFEREAIMIIFLILIILANLFRILMSLQIFIGFIGPLKCIKWRLKTEFYLLRIRTPG